MVWYMFSNYFEQLEKNLLKKAREAQKKAPENAHNLTGIESLGLSSEEIKNDLECLLPRSLTLDAVKLIDSSGFMPDGVDFLIFREQYRNFSEMMGGQVPSEMAYGTIHLARNINSENIADMLKRIIQTKKIDHFTEQAEEKMPIPAFIIGFGSEFEFPKLKEEILDYYLTRNIDHAFEFDIMAILNMGVIIKDWRAKRSFIAIETGKETLKWLFILMNEYVDVERGGDLDLRKYVKHSEKYKEY